MLTNIEGWMVNVIIAVAGVIGTYAVLRNRVSNLEENIKNHSKDESDYKKDIEQKLHAQFRRIDELQNRCTILEQHSKAHLDLVTAEEKFVLKYELDLILKNIELEAKHTSKTLDKMEGKLEELVSILSTTKGVENGISK